MTLCLFTPTSRDCLIDSTKDLFIYKKNGCFFIQNVGSDTLNKAMCFSLVTFNNQLKALYIHIMLSLECHSPLPLQNM
jgi:hypothetical protein